MKQITKVRKSVCAMANQLRKAGYSLKEAFKKAWQRVKLSMTVRAAGTTFKNRQEQTRAADVPAAVQAGGFDCYIGA